MGEQREALERDRFGREHKRGHPERESRSDMLRFEPPAAAGGGAAGAVPASSALAALRRQVAGIGRDPVDGAGRPGGRIALGDATLDAALGGGLARDALHEVFPGGADAAGAVARGTMSQGTMARGTMAHGAALGFTLALAARAAGRRGWVVWVRQDLAALEAGEVHPLGCAEWGLDPARLLVVHAADAVGVLRAAEDALQHGGGGASDGGGAGAVILEPWGAPRVLDLTATRRLALRAERAGGPALLLRSGGEAAPSAAATRWFVDAVPSGEAGGRDLGPPAFALTLARSRTGRTGTWMMEWDGHAGEFKPGLAPQPASSGRGPAVAAHRAPAAPPAGRWRAAG